MRNPGIMSTIKALPCFPVGGLSGPQCLIPLVLVSFHLFLFCPSFHRQSLPQPEPSPLSSRSLYLLGSSRHSQRKETPLADEIEVLRTAIRWCWQRIAYPHLLDHRMPLLLPQTVDAMEQISRRQDRPCARNGTASGLCWHSQLHHHTLSIAMAVRPSCCRSTTEQLDARLLRRSYEPESHESHIRQIGNPSAATSPFLPI